MKTLDSLVLFSLKSYHAMGFFTVASDHLVYGSVFFFFCDISEFGQNK